MSSLEQALDAAARELSEFMCHHAQPCSCTRDRLFQLVTASCARRGHTPAPADREPLTLVGHRVRGTTRTV
jgi:hypothetical protein